MSTPEAYTWSEQRKPEAGKPAIESSKTWGFLEQTGIGHKERLAALGVHDLSIPAAPNMERYLQWLRVEASDSPSLFDRLTESSEQIAHPDKEAA